IFIAIYNGPQHLVAERPTAGEDSIQVHRVERFPTLTDEERRHDTLDGCDPSRCLAIARSHAVPDTPYVFPTLPTLAIEECKLQIVCLVAIPAVLDVDLMARFEPAISVDRGNELEFVRAPGQHIPGKCLVARAALRLEGEGMVHLVR